MSDDNVQDNEMDRLLQGAFESRPRGGGSSPSMVDVRHRARRHQRRRVGGVVGATAMLGVSGVAVLASRGTSETGISGDEATTTWAMTDAGQMCGYTQVVETTTVIFEDVGETISWVVSTVPWEATTTTLSGAPGCIPSGQFRCIGDNGVDNQGYTYFEYCEPVLAGANAPGTMPDSTVGGVDGSSTAVPQPTTTFLPATTWMPAPDPTTTVAGLDPATTPAPTTTP